MAGREILEQAIGQRVCMIVGSYSIQGAVKKFHEQLPTVELEDVTLREGIGTRLKEEHVRVEHYLTAIIYLDNVSAILIDAVEGPEDHF